MAQNPWIPTLAVSIYIVGIVAGRRYFADRPAWNWRKSMALWNLFLSVFSAIGFLRTLPQLLHNLSHYTLTENLCLDPESHYGSGPTGFWVQMFCLSKFPYVQIRD
jgi:elongation of very long chain fatty acids protein 6